MISLTPPSILFTTGRKNSPSTNGSLRALRWTSPVYSAFWHMGRLFPPLSWIFQIVVRDHAEKKDLMKCVVTDEEVSRSICIRI
jgi:hypothetical protein